VRRHCIVGELDGVEDQVLQQLRELAALALDRRHQPDVDDRPAVVDRGADRLSAPRPESSWQVHRRDVGGGRAHARVAQQAVDQRLQPRRAAGDVPEHHPALVVETVARSGVSSRPPKPPIVRSGSDRSCDAT
jgi:hypothetical protein